MNRLTNKCEDGSGYCAVENYGSSSQITLYDYPYDDIEDCVNKLGKLEDIEEELGIDLITLFKALESGVWYKDYKDNDKIKFTDDIEEHKKCKELIVPAKYTIIGLLFKDYGVTWALTREELEDD